MTVIDMDDETQELINLLCTRIGMIMEDASVVALTIGSRDQDACSADVADLKVAAEQIGMLVEAAQSLLRQV